MAGDESDRFQVSVYGFEVRGTSEGGWVLLPPNRDKGLFSPPVAAFTKFHELLRFLDERNPERLVTLTRRDALKENPDAPNR